MVEILQSEFKLYFDPSFKFQERFIVFITTLIHLSTLVRNKISRINDQLSLLIHNNYCNTGNETVVIIPNGSHNPYSSRNLSPDITCHDRSVS